MVVNCLCMLASGDHVEKDGVEELFVFKWLCHGTARLRGVSMQIRNS
jgi:hypothetical protein